MKKVNQLMLYIGRALARATWDTPGTCEILVASSASRAGNVESL